MSLKTKISSEKYRTLLIIWLPFLLVWFWAIRFNPLTHIPSYGDALEVIWGANWYAEKIRHLETPLFFAGVFHPVGWSTALLAHTPIFLLLMGMTRLILPEAVVFNIFTFGSFLVAYLGMLRLVRLYAAKLWIVVLMALLYSFWGNRWARLGGHVHTLWLSALLPWLAWALLSDGSERRKIILAALIWTLCIISSHYGVWLGAFIVGAYFLSVPRKETLRQVVLIGGLTLILSLPTLLSFWFARNATQSPFFDIVHISYWGASINSLPLPSIFHPWLNTIVGNVYPGPYNESGVASLGFIAAVLALVSLAFVRIRDGRQRFAVLILAIGLVLSLGPVLRWSGHPVEIPMLAPINRFLWQIGSSLKPDIFKGNIPAELETAIPLPAWLLMAVVPFFEGARTVARFAFIGGFGLMLLVAQLLERIKATWLLALLAILLIFERVPWPVDQGVPLPAKTHPAFEWLESQRGGQDRTVLDLVPLREFLTLGISGETLYATDFHKKATASGVGSLWPKPAWFLLNWLHRHDRPLQHSALPVILDGYGINWVLLHMKDDQAEKQLQDPDFAGLRLVDCFSGPDGPSPWSYPICVLEVDQAVRDFNIQPLFGWSAEEPWGRWVDGTRSSATWVVPTIQDYELRLDVFPQCVEEKQQSMKITINNQPLDRILFDECNPFSGRIPIASELLNEGWNELSMDYGYAISPAELTLGKNPDPRQLSVGVTSLEMRPVDN